VVTTPQVEPFHLWQELSELPFEYPCCPFQRLEEILTESMEMEPFHSFERTLFELFPSDPEAGAGRAGVVERGVSFRMFWINAQTDRNTVCMLLPERSEPLKLIEGVENQMVRTLQKFNDIGFADSRRKAVYLTAKLLAPEASLPRGAGANAVEGFPDNRENAPHGEPFEGQQYFRTAPLLDRVQQTKVLPQPPKINNVGGRRGKLKNFFNVDSSQTPVPLLLSNVLCLAPQ
jgi:hypothetical protein